MLRQRNNFTVTMTFLNLALMGFLFLVMISTGGVDAAIAGKSREALKSDSTNIVVGTVKAIMLSTDKQTNKNFSTVHGVVEIRVTSVEKGEKIKSADSIYARIWKTGWVGVGSPTPYDSGHRLPKKGETVRVYLIERDGGYDAICPNGFEVVKPDAVAQ